MSSIKDKSTKKRFAITGKPVMFSLSPKMMNHAFKVSGVDAEYGFLPVDCPEKITKMIVQYSLDGVNVTSPFKESVTPFLTSLDGAAKELGCVNTIIKKRENFIGYNTDCFGVKNSIKNRIKKGDLVLVLGTGGATKSALLALHDLGANVNIWGRNSNKSLALSNKFGFHSIEKNEIENIVKKAKLIINTIPQKFAAELLKNMHKNQSIFEASYSNTQTKLLAKKLGTNIIDGKSWLVYQGVEAFKIFTGKSIDKTDMHLGLNGSTNNLYKAIHTTDNQTFNHFYLNKEFNSNFSLFGKENESEEHFKIWLSTPIIDIQEEVKKLNNES